MKGTGLPVANLGGVMHATGPRVRLGREKQLHTAVCQCCRPLVGKVMFSQGVKVPCLLTVAGAFKYVPVSTVQCYLLCAV